MPTILSPIEHPTTTGAPTPEEVEHYRIGREHFVKYCDSHKCPYGPQQASRSNWHDNEICVKCPRNPYNMEATA